MLPEVLETDVLVPLRAWATEHETPATDLIELADEELVPLANLLDHRPAATSTDCQLSNPRPPYYGTSRARGKAASAVGPGGRELHLDGFLYPNDRPSRRAG